VHDAGVDLLLFREFRGKRVGHEASLDAGTRGHGLVATPPRSTYHLTP
jgi:hypothetical protein